MDYRETPVGPTTGRSGLVLRRALLTTVSLSTLLLFTPHEAVARALNGGGAGNGVSAPAIAADAAAQAAQQAAAATRQTQQSLARAARGVQDMQSIQAAARAAAAAAQVSTTAPLAVPNGLGAGGLLPDMPAGWTGANAPTQVVDGKGQTEVNIRQTTQQAILNWQSFNVGARTTLSFDQQGNTGWVALNRVTNATAPSQILGTIKADGHVYVINQSGIIFGGNAQVNVGALIASTAGITDSQFTTNGIFSAQSGVNYTPSFTAAGGGKVVVETGASISTHAPSSVTSGGGYVLMIGSQVDNAGSIATPKGQTLLAAGDSFVLRRGFGTDANQASTTRGIELSPRIAVGSSSGAVVNHGLIFAQQGDITLAGRMLAQGGVLLSTTSVNTRGTIHLSNAVSDSAGSITLGDGSVTAILPELESRETALNSQRDALIAASTAADLLRAQNTNAMFDNLSRLADRQDQSRLEIVTGGTVTFKGGSTAAAQGGQIAVTAGKRIFTEDGARLDVSGVRNVALAMETNNIKINVQGNELRDSPLNRDSERLRNNDVWIDIRTLTLVPAGTGGYASDRYYTAGGLLEVGGYLNTTPHTIGEWSALGGSITLAAPEVIAQRGAVFDLSGGSLDYAAGWIRSTNLIGEDGRRYSADTAYADMKFAGFAGSFMREHNIQGRVDERLTEIWTTIFDRGRHSVRWEEGYSVGRDAGRLILSTPTSIFEADIIADIVTGQRQTAKRANGVTDGYKATQTTAALAGGLAIGQYGLFGLGGAYVTDVRIGDAVPVASSLTIAAPLPTDRVNTFWLDAERLTKMGLGSLDIATAGTITVDKPLALADGGVLKLTAPVIDIKADVTIRSGSLTASNLITVNELSGGTVQAITRQLLLAGKSAIKVGQTDRQVTLDMRGHWVNQPLDPDAASGLAWLDGGSVRLIGTGDVTVAAGTLIDVSSGGAVLSNGKTAGGTGGNISLRAGEPYNGASAGTLTMDGDVRGYGVKGGGTLSLQTGGSWVIGGKVLQTDGKLAAGEVAVIDLILDQTLQLQVGEIAPIDLVLQKTRFDAGATLDRDIKWATISNYIVPGGIRIGSQGWLLPLGMRVVANGVTYAGNSADANLRTVPAGATITQVGSNSSIPIGYFIDPLVLPDGLPVMPYDYLLVAGSVIPTDAAAASLRLDPGHRLSAGSVFSQTLAVRTPDTLTLDTRDAFGNTLLERGFSRYDINAIRGLAVVGDTVLAPRVPTLRLRAEALSAISGDTGRAQAFTLALDPLFREDLRNAELTQRAGADLALRSGMPRSGGLLDDADPGSLYLGRQARISVDPGRDVLLESYGQITVEGRIEAPAGDIAILNPRAHRDLGPGALSIWIGEQAVLDAAGRAYTARDLRGRQYGVVQDGGSIVLGSRGGDMTAKGERPSSDAFIIVRPGAVLDVSGASVDLDDSLFTAGSGLARTSGVNRTVASHGGVIALRSYNGIYLDGMLRAAAGGAQASGGSLIVELESPIYTFTTNGDPSGVPNYLRVGRVLTIGQGMSSMALAAGLRAGQSASGLVVGRAALGASQIEDGGFASASLLGRDRIAFDGDVRLTLDRALTLNQGTLVNTKAGAQVTLAAPYVELNGRTSFIPERYDLFPDLLAEAPAGGVLQINGGLIDVRDRVGANFAGFTLRSTSDLRFLADTDVIADRPTQLANTGDLTLLAGQIYPASHVSAKIYAGATLSVQGGTFFDNWAVTRVAQSSLTIGRVDGAQISPLYSAFGDIAFAANHVVQGGVVRAPLGAIRLEGVGQLASELYPQPTRVELLPGSVTSVSAAGLVIPYGGTIDGVRYTVNGTGAADDAPTFNVISGELNGAASAETPVRGITLSATSIVSHQNSLVDVSGGGQLAGAAFISGRGGSVDALVYARQAGGEVYALVPGTVSAPVTGSYYDAWKGSTPGLGQQVTVPEGVPGLPAGSYLLLPANYALLPGAFRIELGAQQQHFDRHAIAMPNGSYVFGATTGIAGTGIQDSFARTVMLTPGAVVRSWSQFNETGYADFQLAQAARTNAARPMLERDGRFLNLVIKGLAMSHLSGVYTDETPALIFDGRAEFFAASNGYAGALGLLQDSLAGMDLAIVAPGGSTTRTAGSGLIGGLTPIAAATLNAIGAPALYIGGLPTFEGAFKGGSVVNIGGAAFGVITLTSGAVLHGGQFFLTTYPTGQIKLDAGAGLSTLGWAAATPDSSLGYQFRNTGLVVSSGRIDLAPLATGSNSIKLDAGAFLHAEGTLGFSANGAIDIDQAARLGARYLGLSSASFNIGTEQSLQAARQAGVLSAGMILTQDFMNRLLQGDPASGVPAAQSLMLTAKNALNFLGTVSLSTYDPRSGASLLDELVVNTPSIYGWGGAQDVASIETDTLVWRGNFTSVQNVNTAEVTHTSSPPGAVIPGGAGTGTGTLDVHARQIVLGWPKVAQAHRELDLHRLALGFSTVNLGASERIVSNNRGNLAVFQSGPSPDAAYNPATYSGVGGNLNLITPLLTGASGSDVTYRTGGALTVRAPAASAASSASDGELGAIVNLVADRIDVATAVLLPSGRLTLRAQNDVVLRDGARLDVSGRRIDFFDTARYSAGGEVVAESAHGSILAVAGSSIDVSADNNDAGRLQFTATDAASGRVRLNGAFRGAGGAGYGGGILDVRAQLIGDSAASLSSDFAALNNRLNDAGFTGGRSFALKQGSLSIGNELRGREINVSVDGGSLVVTGRIDASGLRPGSIRLAARDDLTLASSAVLDAHATQLQVDSYGQPIEAKNRGTVELTSSQGWLRLTGGSTIDLSSADGQARGKVELSAGRVDETGGDIRIEARNPIAIRGADSVAVNAVWSYSPTDADGSVKQDNGGTTPVAADGSVGLDQIDLRNQQFMTAALANGDLGNRLAGLAGNAFHLRPGVEINSSATPSGNLTVKGDLDLSRYRYGSAADRNPLSPTYGAGEVGSFVLRAKADLTVNGSITDGFGRPAPTIHDNGWMISGLLTSDTVARLGGTLGSGSVFPGGIASTLVLPFDVSVAASVLRRGVPIPFTFISRAVLAVPAWATAAGGWATTANIYNAAGQLLYSAGDRVNAAIPTNSTFAAGTVLPSTIEATPAGSFNIMAVTVTAGNSFNVFNANVTSVAAVALAPGTLLPAGITLSATSNIPTRLTGPDGRQGDMWSFAPLLPSGTQSWSMRLVSGADLGAADTRGLQGAVALGAAGNTVLSDAHVSQSFDSIALSSVIRTGTGNLDLLAGGNFRQDSLFGIYTAGTPVLPAAGVAIRQGTYLSDHGGDLTLTVQGSLTGRVIEKLAFENSRNNFGVGNWLVRTGAYQTAQRATWSINYGNEYAQQWYGFGGIGTLGGGNVSVLVGRDAGVIGGIAVSASVLRSSTGLVFAIGSSGYVAGGNWDPTTHAVVGGELRQFGGGDLSVRIGGRLNPGAVSTDGISVGDDFNGSFTNMRGDIDVAAATIGSVLVDYGRNAVNDPRAVDAYRTSMLRQGGQLGGPVLVLGDGAARLHALGDIVLGGVGDAGQVLSPASTGEWSGKTASRFSLWSQDTAVELVSLGGNMAPLHLSRSMTANEDWLNSNVERYHSVVPSRFDAVAASGSLYFGYSGEDPNDFGIQVNYYIDVAPSPSGALNLLAQKSIHAAAVPAVRSLTGGPAVSFRVIGIDADAGSIPNPLKPTNSSTSPLGFGNFYSFDDGIGTAPRDGSPIRLYAVDGDITNFLLNERLTTVNSTPIDWTVAAAQPVRVRAGGDIVNFGSGTTYGGFSPSVIVNGHPNDVSIISAGRDILFANVMLGGPGALEVSAGRNIYQGDKGAIVSVGPMVPNDTRPGASIFMQAGAGAAGPNFAGLMRYLSPANLATAGVPLADQPGKVAKTYQTELRDWLDERYGRKVAGDDDALAYFALLAPEQQRIFLRNVYFAELKAGGREYNDVNSSRYGSYLRGRNAIAALFPDTDATGKPLAYGGDITMFSTEHFVQEYNPVTFRYDTVRKTSDGAVRTQFGGDIQMLVPNGKIVIGVEGTVPGATAGVVTQGTGDIQMFARGSILLGLSRVMTTFGGNILGWSAEGDINAGRGAKTTVVYTPPKRVYDKYGRVTLSPDVPSSGAGIATLNPIPEVAAGDIDLIAPLGTIDAGEAGIRVSGNINLAALQILNAANIQVQGSATGIPTVQAPSIAAALTTSNATAATQQTATPTQGSGNERPSVIIVEVLGYGGGENGQDNDDQRRKRDDRRSYDPTDPVRVVGYGPLSRDDTRGLTPEEQQKLTGR